MTQRAPFKGSEPVRGTAAAAPGLAGVQQRRSVITFRPLRPPLVIRRDRELAEALRVVELVEREGEGSLKEDWIPGRPQRGQRPPNPSYLALLADFEYFLRHGASSLTPYEATMLRVGIGIGGTYGITPVEEEEALERGYRRGDRIELAFELAGGGTFKTRGIAVDRGILAAPVRPDSNEAKAMRVVVLYPDATPGLRNLRVLSSALNDGKLERLYG